MEVANILLLQSTATAQAADAANAGTKNSEYGPTFEEVFREKTDQKVNADTMPVSGTDRYIEDRSSASAEPVHRNEDEQQTVVNKEQPESKVQPKGKGRSEDSSSEGASNLKIVNPKNKKGEGPKKLLDGRESTGKTRKTKNTRPSDLKSVEKNIISKSYPSLMEGKPEISESDQSENAVLQGMVESAAEKNIDTKRPNTVTLTITLGDDKAAAQQVPGEVAQTVRKNLKQKKFFFIDQRTGHGKTAEKGINDNRPQGNLREFLTGGKLKNRGIGENNPNRTQDSLQSVKNGILDSSDTFIKLSPVTVEGRSQTAVDTQVQRQPQTTALMRHLTDLGNKQIVRQTGIILKNDNSGEIRLVLKPESMGNVRIQLQMNENIITGKILVDNSAVKYAFDQNMQELYKALKDSGFESAQLDVQVGGEGRGENRQDEKGRPGLTLHRIQMMEEQIPLIGSAEFADNLIDLVI